MPTVLECPLCRVRNQVPLVVPGKKAVCPTCGHVFQVPRVVTESRQPTQPPPVPVQPPVRLWPRVGLTLAGAVVVMLVMTGVVAVLVNRGKEPGGSRDKGRAVAQAPAAQAADRPGPVKDGQPQAPRPAAEPRPGLKADAVQGLPKPEPEKPVASVKAADLWEEYGRNALAADAKYKGKLLKVWGKVKKLEKSVERDGYFVGLEVYMLSFIPPPSMGRLPAEDRYFAEVGFPPGVIGYIDPAAQKQFAFIRAERWQDQGDAIEIIGRCQGSIKNAAMYRGYYVVLEDCSRVKPAAVPPKPGTGGAMRC